MFKLMDYFKQVVKLNEVKLKLLMIVHILLIIVSVIVSPYIRNDHCLGSVEI